MAIAQRETHIMDIQLSLIDYFLAIRFQLLPVIYLRDYHLAPLITLRPEVLTNSSSSHHPKA